MLQLKNICLFILHVSLSILSTLLPAQTKTDKMNLSATEQSLVKISMLAAKGDLPALKKELNNGLDAGLTVNEIKEGLVHLYAYAGFPRSLRGIHTFMEVLDERAQKGIHDNPGKEASSINSDTAKYTRGKRILATLTNTSPNAPITGYGAFAPVVDTLLKEHLFADLFERDVLTYQQRELVAISTIAAQKGLEPMLQSHLSICLNLGFSPQQLKAFVALVTETIGAGEGNVAKAVLEEVLASQEKLN